MAAGRDEAEPLNEAAPPNEPGAARPEVGDPRESESMCVRTGGFEDRRVLAAVEEWLRSHGADAIELHRVEEGTIRNHQVYLPPFPSRAQAVAAARAIQANGVRDVAVIASGPFTNGISFGVFREEENARRRKAALSKIGYPVRQKENRSRSERYVLAARAGPDPDALRVAWGAAFPKRTIELASCE